MESIQNFIQQVSTGQSSEAKETLNDMISARAFEALNLRKQELASNIFNGKQEKDAIENEPETTEGETVEQ